MRFSKNQRSGGILGNHCICNCTASEALQHVSADHFDALLLDKLGKSAEALLGEASANSCGPLTKATLRFKTRSSGLKSSPKEV